MSNRYRKASNGLSSRLHGTHLRIVDERILVRVVERFDLDIHVE
jgi:hypothetical protein